MKKNILACYLRISDEDFDQKQNILKNESTSISAQRQLIRDYIKSDPVLRQMNTKEFLDDGYSGTSFDRPAIQELFQLVFAGKVDGIIVKDMSRFGRNYIETGHYIEQIFPSMGIRFIAINDSFDSAKYIGNTPELEMTFKTIFYDYYSKDLSTKVKSIKKIQQNRGDFVAAKPPYGYIISLADRHKLEIDPESAEVVKTIFRLTLSGWKPVAIAQQLNKMHISTPAQRLHRLYGFQCGFTEKQLTAQYWKPRQITKILQDETMIGATVNNRVQVTDVGSRKFKRQKTEDYVIVQDTHEAIIDQNTFRQVAAIIRNRTTVHTSNRQKNENLFCQKIYCGHCGCRLKHEVHTRHSQIYAIYYCPHARPSGGATCNLHSIKDEIIKESVLRLLQTQLQLIWNGQMPLPKSGKEIIQTRLQTILRLSKQNKEKIPRLYEEYRTGNINREQFIKQKDVISSANNKLDLERSEIEEKLSTIESSVLQSESFLELAKLKTLTQNVVDLFVNKVVVNLPNSIAITWRSKDLFDDDLSV